MARFTFVVAAIVSVAILAGSAAAKTVILRQGLSGYTGVEDTMLESNNNFDGWWGKYANLGEASQGLRLWSNATRSALVKFDGLDTAILDAGSADILSATLSLNQGAGDLASTKLGDRKLPSGDRAQPRGR